ncbi:MAG: hypothetical protein HY926_09275 [Elusimicrobia bacterium]|nr:hypothetical protein [Elusimicrobiota bacterium]
MGRDECAILYSGGTDSTCVAALLAEKYPRLHLLTFREAGTRDTPDPKQNIENLRRKFSRNQFIHQLFFVDGLLEKISYDRYFSYLRRHGFFMLSTCGFSSLSWHTRMIVYCLDNDIPNAADGITRELMHFPGHMDVVLAELRLLYQNFGIAYANPVRDWDVPTDQRFLDRLIVDRHGFTLSEDSAHDSPRKTTGRHLYQLGLLPHPNVKGSPLDRSMQHSCYPFVLFNIFAFWYYLSYHDRAQYEREMADLFRRKIGDVKSFLEEYRELGPRSRLAAWI